MLLLSWVVISLDAHILLLFTKCKCAEEEAPPAKNPWCKLLSRGHMITAVGGNGGYSGGKQFIMAEQLRKKLAHLRHERALIVKLVDIVDFNGSFLARVRDLAGANPIIIVITKVDLLPKGTDFNCIGDWVVEATAKKKARLCDKCLSDKFEVFGWSNWSCIRDPKGE
ncbi:unnamed protein product [Prunus armeniaca]|uniref:G domain-containing protein n=1 Tax=Prunus armeniaca TaxID=36596 RepID=A0A6J5WUX4_PRUAR|nr:unnamed protein product [Prunus armeniaca]